MSPWIMGSTWKDMTSFYAIGVMLLVLSKYFSGFETVSASFIVFAVIAVDSGHGYLTALRFVWKPLNERFFALSSFAAVFVGVVLWTAFELPYFWSFVAYFTIYHHYKQFYGVLRWYELRAGQSSRMAPIYFRTMFWSSIAGLHFRNIELSFYGEADLFFYPSPVLEKLALSLYISALLAYLVYELRKKKFFAPRMTSVLIPSVLQGVCLFFGETFVQIVVPLVFIHGLTYWSLLSKSITVESRVKISFRSAAWFCFVLLILAGIWESFWVDSGTEKLHPSAIALIVAPAIWHYWMDSKLWRSRDEASKRIFYS